MSYAGIPRLETERLVLRAFENRDFDSYAEMLADPEVTRFLGDGRPLTRMQAWQQFAMYTGHWVLRGFGVWAVEERSTGKFIGRVGCFQPEGWPGFEVCYTLARSAWGHGFAKEAARSSLKYARDFLQQERIISIVRPANAASIRVAQALGATEEGFVGFFGSSASIYVYPKSSEGFY